MAYYDFLNVVFAPLLKLPILWTVIILSFIVSIIIIIITKYTTDQALMEKLKGFSYTVNVFFTLGIGGIWEVFEFLGDKFLGLKQKRIKF